MAGVLVCLGAGFSARALAGFLAPHGWRIRGTCRSAAGRARLRAGGIEAHLFDSARPLRAEAQRALLAGATHLLISIPPGGGRRGAKPDPVLHCLEAGLDRHAGGMVWAGYLSTTAVYGDRGGGRVDEHSPVGGGFCAARGRRRLAAERAWQAWALAHGVQLDVFRLAGIYGPGRNPLRRLAQGAARRIYKPGQVFSRIHVEDLARVVAAAMAAPRHAGGTYNVCDDEPAPAPEVIRHAARLLGRPSPPLTPLARAQLSLMARGFYAENRRVSNRRIRFRLGVELLYPTYREGLRALLAQGEGAPSSPARQKRPRRSVSRLRSAGVERR